MVKTAAANPKHPAYQTLQESITSGPEALLESLKERVGGLPKGFDRRGDRK